MNQPQKNWNDEQTEFFARVENSKPGLTRRFGLTYVVREPESLETSGRKNSFRAFLIPEKNLSLKIFFDNLRNYAVCAAFLALGAAVWNHGERWLALLVSFAPGWISPVSAVAIWVMAGGLLAINVAQSWLLLRELLDWRRLSRITEIYIYPGERHSVLDIWKSIALAFLSVNLLLLEWIFSIFVGLLIVCISVGFVAYVVLVRSV